MIAHKPIQGFDFNPFLKYPRNKQCYCNSGKKFKKCCLDSEAGAIPKDIAEKARDLIKALK